MGLYQITPELIAGGNINPRSFVKLDPSNDMYGIQAGVGDTPIGIASPGTDTAPQPSNTTNNYNAVANEDLFIYGPGSIVELQAGASWTRGNFLKADANGYGTPATNIYDSVGAYALESVNSGEYGRVIVMPVLANLSAKTVKVVTANTTLTAQDSGKIIYVNGTDLTITLPSTASGLDFTIVNAPAATGGSTGTTVAVQAADKVHGDGFTAAAGKGAVNTHATAADGDWIRLIGNSIDGFNIVGAGGTWARVA